jgi:hypothetical protein
LALGQLGLKLKYFYSLTPRQFTNIERGYRKQEDTLSKERCVLTRKIMWATAFPHLKEKITEEQLWPLPWDVIIDENLEQIITAKESEKLKADAEKVKEFYKKIDEKKKSQSE